MTAKGLHHLLVHIQLFELELAGGGIDPRQTGILAIAAIIGGFFGSRWGAGRARESTLRRIFAVVALVVLGIGATFFNSQRERFPDLL